MARNTSPHCSTSNNQLYKSTSKQTDTLLYRMFKYKGQQRPRSGHGVQQVAVLENKWFGELERSAIREKYKNFLMIKFQV